MSCINKMYYYNKFNLNEDKYESINYHCVWLYSSHEFQMVVMMPYMG